ncbi:hypothetical protein ACFQV2_12850 [Actinokineospora soli]|uniref:WD40-like Beta Propeller Repeat n=1 Tax=Actinokineospora soli TaxID=1048753 RepID=A0ABW2TLP9_9PSEU
MDRLVVPDAPEAAGISVAEPPEPPEPVYAFAATSRLGVVRGGEVIAEVPIEPSAFGALVPAFTTDGRFAFAAGATGVAVVEVETGSVRKVACGGCDVAAPVGDSRIAWLAAGRIMVLDAETTDPQPGPTVRFEPSVPSFSGPPRLVAGAPGRVVVAAADGVSAYGGPEELIVVDLAGGQRSMGIIDGNTRIGTVVVSPDGSRLAYDAAWHVGACEEQGHIAIVDLASGEQRTTAEIGPRTSRPGARRCSTFGSTVTASCTRFSASGRVRPAVVRWNSSYLLRPTGGSRRTAGPGRTPNH